MFLIVLLYDGGANCTHTARKRLSMPCAGFGFVQKFENDFYPKINKKFLFQFYLIDEENRLNFDCNKNHKKNKLYNNKKKHNQTHFSSEFRSILQP